MLFLSIVIADRCAFVSVWPIKNLCIIAMHCFTKYYLYFPTDKSDQTESQGISNSSSILGKLCFFCLVVAARLAVHSQAKTYNNKYYKLSSTLALMICTSCADISCTYI